MRNEPEFKQEIMDESTEFDDSEDEIILINKAKKMAQKAICEDELNKDSAISELIDNKIPPKIAQESVGSIIFRRHIVLIITIIIGFIFIFFGIFIYSYSDNSILKYISDLLVILGAIIFIDVFIDIIKSRKKSRFKKKS